MIKHCFFGKGYIWALRMERFPSANMGHSKVWPRCWWPPKRPWAKHWRRWTMRGPSRRHRRHHDSEPRALAGMKVTRSFPKLSRTSSRLFWCCEQKNRRNWVPRNCGFWSIDRIRDSASVQGHEKEPLGERQYAMPRPQSLPWAKSPCTGHSLKRPTNIPSGFQAGFFLLKILMLGFPGFRGRGSWPSLDQAILVACQAFQTSTRLSFTSIESRQRVLVDGGYGEEEKERLGDLQPEAWRTLGNPEVLGCHWLFNLGWADFFWFLAWWNCRALCLENFRDTTVTTVYELFLHFMVQDFDANNYSLRLLCWKCHRKEDESHFWNMRSVSNWRIQIYPESTPDLIPKQAQLRRLMGSDEQVLVLDVYCALAPKELMACVVSPQRQACLQHCVSCDFGLRYFRIFFVICPGVWLCVLECHVVRKISSVASTMFTSQHERCYPTPQPIPIPSPTPWQRGRPLVQPQLRVQVKANSNVVAPHVYVRYI